MRKIQRRISAATVLCLVLASAAFGAVEEVTYKWTAPTTGTDPVLYRIEMRFADRPDPELSFWSEVAQVTELVFTWEQDTAKCYQFRCRAEDKDGKLGPYSIPSEWECGPDVPAPEEGEGLGPADPGKPGTKGDTP